MWLDACIKAIDDNQKLVLDFFATKHPRSEACANHRNFYLQWLDQRFWPYAEELDHLLQFQPRSSLMV